ncbi:hypothetical protein NQ315_015883 [Exocentrus adspersus]|uniref:RING-type E3 ubiquitin transferase n=1 Tax=Exocentrus adspersus TaxID=1586481 RepID=A0AAV8W549_9CUCU|nr:hypothetical protein NQ315_015883 [Exocentrus adspersus]
MDQQQQQLLKSFECPICTKYIVPPIRQCCNGHSICQKCFDKISICALCRGRKVEGRALVLERISSLLTFPCAYAEDGCDFRGPGDNIALHQSICAFSSVMCPLRFYECSWRGEKADVVVHCQTVHPQNFFFSSSKHFRSSRFCVCMNRTYHLVFYVFGNLFRLTWDLEKESGHMRLAMYCLRKNVDKDKFRFEMSCLMGQEKFLSVAGSCLPLQDDSDKFLRGKCFILNYDLVKECCDEDGDLNYAVTISKN